MKKTFQLLIVASGLLLYSCDFIGEAGGGGGGSAKVPESFNADKMVEQRTDLENIIDAGMVAKVAGVDQGKIEVSTEKYSEDPNEYKALYSWDSGKEITVGSNVQLSQFYSLGLANVQKLSQEEFDKQFGSKEGVLSRAENMIKNASLSEEEAQFEKEYWNNYAGQQQLTEVKNVGDKAYWEMPIQVLHVFANGVAFSITSNFGEDEATNKGKAIELTKVLFENLK